MNKNQKHMPYSFSKLVYGNKVVIAFHQSNVDRINKQIKKAKMQNKDTTELAQALKYQQEQIEYFREENSRYSLCAHVCGDATVLVR